MVRSYLASSNPSCSFAQAGGTQHLHYRLIRLAVRRYMEKPSLIRRGCTAQDDQRRRGAHLGIHAWTTWSRGLIRDPSGPGRPVRRGIVGTTLLEPGPRCWLTLSVCVNESRQHCHCLFGPESHARCKVCLGNPTRHQWRWFSTLID
jgi:hypothetical protein